MSSNAIGKTPPQSAPAPCRLRLATFSDYEQIVRLQSRYHLQTKSYAEWSRLWLGNPAYQELQSSWPVGWVLEDDGGRVVGYLGNIPLIYLFRGTRLRVSTSYAWVVEEEYRGFSLWLLEEYFLQKGVDLFVNTSVSDQAIEAYSVFGSSKVPVGAWDQTSFAITSTRGFAESVLRRKRVPLPTLLSFPAAAGLLCQEWASRVAAGGRLSVRHSEIRSPGTLEFGAGFDPRFDRFWQEVAEHAFDKLVAERSREVLEWRFAAALARREVWIVIHGDPSRIFAYAIFARCDRPEFKLKRMQLVDFQSLDGSRAMLIPMLQAALERCHRERLHMLEYVGVRLEEGDIARLLPVRRTLPSWLYFYQATKSDLADQLRDSTSWDPLPFDGDLTL
jgi:hypothetical protein